MKGTYEITTAHFRFYVHDTRTGEAVGFFKTLGAATEAYPTASLNVPEGVKKAYLLSKREGQTPGDTKPKPVADGIRES